MIQRIRVRPIAQMARCLAAYPAPSRDTPEAAMLLLQREGLFTADDIAVGVDEALALVRDGLVLAASDHPAARALNHARDLAAVLVLLIGGGYLWAVLP
ncbi:MAG: hypothetical protein WAP03_13250 [Methylorubrum rhodinum]|uniref:hypothetical protein n=1 Tax=Methylorubrum rhodinum TaxID=29428 RepID=UPI003BB13CD0